MDAGYAAGDYTATFGGTSSATPLVAGVCGLVLAVNPALSAAEVKQIVQETARKIGDPADYGANGHSQAFGYGCIDAAAAVRVAAERAVAAQAQGGPNGGVNGAHAAVVLGAANPKGAAAKKRKAV